MTVKQSTRTVNYLTSGLCGVLGATLCVAPEFFWGPTDGVMPFTFATTTACQNGHFDPATLWALRASGALVLGFFLLAPLCMSLETFHSKSVLRYKLVFYTWHVVYFSYYGWVVTDPMLVRSFFQAMALVKTTLSIWLTLAIRHDKSLPEGPVTTCRPNHATILFWVSVPFLLPWALIFMLAPNQISPAGRLPFFVHDEQQRQQQQQQHEFNALQTCAIVLQGVHLMACLIWMYDCVKHATRIGVKFAMPPLLYTWSLICTLRDQTGYVDRPKYMALLAVHMGYVAFFVKTVVTPEDGKAGQTNTKKSS